MSADPDDAFEMDARTGEIQLKPYIKSMEIVRNITLQKDCKWSLVVQARDCGSPSFSATAVVNVDITEATPLKGPVAAFLMRSRDNPMKALGVLTFIISLSVGATVLISTAIYMRNAKSQNRVTPARRVIKRRPGRRQPRTFDVLSFKFGKPSEKFLAQDPEGSPEQESGTPRTRQPRPPPPPPCAPCLPPPVTGAPERSRAVPTISGVLASKGSRKGKRGGRKEGNVSSALVSELKMRLEQKMRENNQGYF